MSARVLPEDAVAPIGLVSARMIPWRHRGVLRVTVVAKATFAFANDAPMPRVAPRPLYATEVRHTAHVGDAAMGGRALAGSPRYTPDLYPRLDRPELLFTGHAHAANGAVSESTDVRIGLFDGTASIFDKRVVVRQRGGVTRVPLTYDRAYGGPSFLDNPIGVGADRGSGEPAVVMPGQEGRPAGFGPIGALWAPRRGLLGGAAPPKLDGSIVELPDAFDFGYFQAAPLDQRLPSLRGDEWVVMDGVHAASPRLRMRLPGARASARLFGLAPFGIASGAPLALEADVLRLDGDDLCATLTFRGAFGLPSEEALDALLVVAGVELPNEQIAWPAPERAPTRRAAPPVASAHAAISSATAPLPSLRGVPASTPFRAGPAPDGVVRSPGPPAARRATGPAEAGTADYSDLLRPAAPVLPFVAAEPAPVDLPAAAPPAPARAPAAVVTAPARSPWAPSVEAAPSAAAPARARPATAPKRVDVRAKLYGPGKKP